MPNRMTRDELIKAALAKAMLPNLEQHDVPGGVVQQNAFAVDWLREIVDFWYHMVPFSATVTDQSLTLLANSDTVVLPEDFIVDVRDGLIVQTIPGSINSMRRRKRSPLQKFISQQLEDQGKTNINYPNFYCVVGDDNDIMTQHQTMRVTPTPTVNVVAKLWYYRLPPVLAANQKPKVPTDYVCEEYLRLRALEWAGAGQAGSAHAFAMKLVGDLRASGLLNEPESDSIPFDSSVFGSRKATRTSPSSWMGPP